MNQSPSPDWSKSSPQTMEAAEFVYQCLIASTQSPRESAEVLSILYVRLWLQGHAPNADLELNLASFCDCIRTNVELDSATRQ